MKNYLMIGSLVLFGLNFAVGCGDDSNRQVEPPKMDAAEQQKQYDDYDKQEAAAAKNYN